MSQIAKVMYSIVNRYRLVICMLVLMSFYLIKSTIFSFRLTSQQRCDAIHIQEHYMNNLRYKKQKHTKYSK